MSKAENNSTKAKPKVLLLSIASVLFGIICIGLIITRSIYYRLWWSEYIFRNILGMSGIISLITGIIAIKNFSKRIEAITLRYGMKTESKGRIFVYLSTIIGLLASSTWFMETCGPVSTATTMACAFNLQKLGKAIMIYSNDDQGRYPDPNKWCELLLKYEQVDENILLCPEIKFRWRRQILPFPIPKNKGCYYAINPNCEPDSSSDTVLLFETKGGWNISGGHEILSIENHRGGSCNILFNDGHVEYIYRTEELNDLKWK